MRAEALRGVTFRAAVRLLGPYLYLFLVAMVAASVHIARYTEFSPIDELRHVDYAMRVSKLDFPRYGDLLGQESMREEACRGVELAWIPPPCESESFDPVDFRDDGYQIASIHPPSYYLGAGWFARVAMALGISDSFVDPARVFSALLLAAGLMVTYVAGRVLGLRAPPLLVALTFVPLAPTVLHSASTVNPDSSAILVGGIVLLVALLWERGRVPTWVLPLAGALATGIKFTSMLAVLVVAAVFLVRADVLGYWRARRARAATVAATVPGDGSDRERAGGHAVDANGVVPAAWRTRPEYLRAVLWLVLPALSVAAIWNGIDGWRAVVEPIVIPQVRENQAHGLPSLQFLFDPHQVYAWFPPTGGLDTHQFLSVYVVDVRTMMTFLFAGATLMASFRVNRRDDISLFAVSALVAGVLGGPAYVLLNAIVQDILLVLPDRYGLSLLPFLTVILASFVANRIGLALIGGMALVSYAVVVGTMLVR